MDLLPLMPGFVLAVLLISASPGPATALVLRRAAVGGFRGALPTVLGLELGLYVWALSAGAGLSGVVAASELAYAVMRALGAALLIYLGVSAWRPALRGRLPLPPLRLRRAQLRRGREEHSPRARS